MRCADRSRGPRPRVRERSAGTRGQQGGAKFLADGHRIEWLRETGDRADAQRPPRFIALGLRREEEHGNVGRSGIRLEEAAGLVSIEPGHHPVEEDRVECAARGARDGLVPRVDDLDIHFRVETEGQSQNGPDIWLIVGAKQPHGTTGKSEGPRARDPDAGLNTTNPGVAGNARDGRPVCSALSGHVECGRGGA